MFGLSVWDSLLPGRPVGYTDKSIAVPADRFTCISFAINLRFVRASHLWDPATDTSR